MKPKLILVLLTVVFSLSSCAATDFLVSVGEIIKKNEEENEMKKNAKYVIIDSETKSKKYVKSIEDDV